jgi:twinkle protein
MSKTWSEFGIEVKPGASGNYATTCPQCSPHRKNSKAKCLSVNIEEEIWNCHHCSWSGTLKKGTDRKSNPWEWTPKVFKKPAYVVKPPSNPMIEWFKKRGIPAEVVTRNKIMVSRVWMPQIEGETDCMQFPFIRNGEVINIKSRDGNKNFRQEAGAERIFYGMDDVSGSVAIIVEGEIDKLSCETAGYPYSVSVPDGAPSPKAKDYTSKFEFLENCEEWLQKLDKIILAVDTDEPGKKLEEELARRLGREKCWRVQWPEDCKDANEVLVKHGKEVLASCLESARPYPVAGVFDISDISDQIDQYYHDGAPGGDKVGWPCMESLYSVRTGEWTLITGIPGHGKSEFLDAMMVNLAFNYGWTFAVFSPENQPLQQHSAKLAEKYIGKPFNRGVTERMSLAELYDAKKWMSDKFTFILPDSDELTVNAVLLKAKTAILRKGVKGIVIDPWNELDHQRPAGLSETEYISRCLTTIRRFAREHNVHIWLVAHPAKLQKDRLTGKYPVPTPYDVSGSANWRNKADNAITVFREFIEGDKRVQIHVQKIRFKNIGRTGVTELEYNYVTGRYTDPGDTSKEKHYTEESMDMPF